MRTKPAAAPSVPSFYNQLSPGEAQVAQEIRQDAFAKAQGPLQKAYTPAELSAVFDPPQVAYLKPLGQLTPAVQVQLEAIAKAPDLGAALRSARELPGLFAVAGGGAATVFELRLSRMPPDAVPNDWQKTYATSCQLVAQPGLTRNHFRLQSVHHDSVRINNLLSRGPDVVAYDGPVRIDFATGLFSAEPATPGMLTEEMRGTLTPASLAAALRQLLETGLPTRVDRAH